MKSVKIKLDKSMVDRWDKRKIKITHGIFHKHFLRNKIYCRNTTKYLPLPLKFRELLEEKYLQWWYFKTSIWRFNKRVSVRRYLLVPVEFTIAHEPNVDQWIISIVHPLDVFKRNIGVKIVKERMEWALKHPNNKRWSYRLK